MPGYNNSILSNEIVYHILLNNLSRLHVAAVLS